MHARPFGVAVQLAADLMMSCKTMSYSKNTIKSPNLSYRNGGQKRVLAGERLALLDKRLERRRLAHKGLEVSGSAT